MMGDGGAATAATEPDLASSRARETRNVRNLYRQTAWQGPISAAITTFLPVFAVRAGASTFAVGLLTSVPALVVVLLSIPAASFAAAQHRLVRLVTLTLLGIWGCTIAIMFLPSVLVGAAARYVPWGIVALAGLSAVFSAASNPAWTAVLADAVSPRRRPVVNGQRWALLSVVSAATVFVAGWYLDAVAFPFGYQSLFVGAVLAGAVSLFYLNRIETTTGGHDGDARLPGAPRWGLANVPHLFRGQRAFAHYVGTMFVYRLGIALPAALYPIFWVDELRTPDAWIGFRATAAQASLVVSYALWGRIAGRRGYRSVLIACGLGTAAYPALTAIVPSPPWLIPVAVLWGFFAGGVDVGLFEGLIEAVPADQRVVYAAINTTFANLTVLIGPLLGIALVAAIGMRGTFWVAAAVCVLGALVYYALARTRAPAAVSEARVRGE